MGALMVEESGRRKSPNLSTETVEMLLKSSLFSTCKLGFLLRIWHFAQDFVKTLAAVSLISYLIEINIFTGIDWK
jgi:hypothetical protein